MNRKIYRKEQVQEKEVNREYIFGIYDFVFCWKLGVPVVLSDEEGRKAQATITEYGFNMVASDKISLDDHLTDYNRMKRKTRELIHV